MPESFSTRVKRRLFNFYPVYRRTGARITYIDDTWREVRVRLPLRPWTRNYVGTISGISMFGAVDPIYMVMLIKLLGPKYIVWDKSAAIRFKKPGRRTLTAHFRLEETELADIRRRLDQAPSLDRTYRIDLVDPDGTVCATVEKVIHIKKKRTGSPEAIEI